MKMLGMLRGTLVLFTVALLASKAQAIAITDVSFTIPPTYTPTLAEGFSGNDSESVINGLFPSDPWTLLDKTDGSGSVYMGVRFNLTASAPPPDGDPDNYTWALSWEEEPAGSNGLALTTEFVFATKGGGGGNNGNISGAAYYFNSITFPVSPDNGAGTFLINYTNNGGQIPDLSHASVYARNGSSGGPGTGTGSVPVPGTLFLLGLGLLGLSRSRRVGA